MSDREPRHIEGERRKRENQQVRKIAALLIVTTFTISLFAFASVAPPASAAPQTLPDYQGVDVPNARTNGFTVDETIQGPSHHSYFKVGDHAYWLVYNDVTGRPSFRNFTLRAIGSITEVWVADNLSFPASDPPRPYPTVLDSEVSYLLNEFESKIYPNDTQYFGFPAYHNGSNAQLPGMVGLPSDYYTEQGGRNVILVANIRDQNYYDPTYPYFIIGVFVPSYNFYFDRNVITIDCFDWEHRIGPTGTQWIPSETVPSSHAHDYESTIAHEYQHLIHNVMNAGDMDFMNEGCSMYAELLCGYGIGTNYLNSYFATPDNSLTVWGDQGGINILADYGESALWTIYLSDHYGGASFISYFVQSGVGGIDGINAALAHFGYKATFDTVYRDWRLANLIRSDTPGHGKYNYKSLNLNAHGISPVSMYPISGLPVRWTKGTSFGNTTTILGYDTGISMIGPYGTDYVKFTDWKRPGWISFKGDKTATTTTWTLTADGWYSGSEDLYEALLAGRAYVKPSNPTLTLVTNYGIESFWDFGFVQVSTDGGETWKSLANEYTTADHDPSAYCRITANLPGLTDYSLDYPDWTTMTFDLSAYAGKNILVGFRYMTDWATTYEGWYIQSASVSGKALKLNPVYPEIDFQVTVVQATVWGGKVHYEPLDMFLFDWKQYGSALGFAKSPSYVILVVSPTTWRGYADYRFSVSAPAFCYGPHHFDWY